MVCTEIVDYDDDDVDEQGRLQEIKSTEVNTLFVKPGILLAHE